MHKQKARGYLNSLALGVSALMVYDKIKYSWSSIVQVTLPFSHFNSTCKCFGFYGKRKIKLPCYQTQGINQDGPGCLTIQTKFSSLYRIQSFSVPPHIGFDFIKTGVT